MPKPQQRELARSGKGSTDSDSAKIHADVEPVIPDGGATGGPGPVPEDNLPGHHPAVEQDKPVAKFRRRAAKVADEARQHQLEVRPLEIEAGGMTFTGLEAGGRGELVILLHGFPQDSTSWEHQLSALATAGYHAVAFDQRGYSPGARPPGASAYRLDSLVEDVMAVAEELHADRFHLVGHDWGGVVAWAVAARFPDTVASLTVLSTPHPRAYTRSVVRSTQLIRSGYVGLFALPVVPEVVLGAGRGFLLRRALTRSGLPGPAADRYVGHLGTRGLSAALNWYRAAGSALGGVDEVKVPTAYLWGDRDFALGPTAARDTGRFVSGPYRFEVMEGAGHWLPETRADEVTRHILDHVGSAQGSRRAASG
ncbi:MAG TPA: alpha/beta fold hydrolase [Acidimicrobiales bacterium]|nr:alpha/beta fold hydrolase [Acidimicrobiales bacterium]